MSRLSLTASLNLLALTLSTSLAFAGPLPSRNITFQVSRPTGSPITLTTEEGTPVIFQEDQSQKMFAFVPVVADARAQRVQFSIYRVTLTGSGQKEMSELDRIEAHALAPSFTASSPSFGLEVMRISRPSPASVCRPAAGDAFAGGLQNEVGSQTSVASGTCHVSCGGVSIWACAGDTGTGCSCCADPCC